MKTDKYMKRMLVLMMIAVWHGSVMADSGKDVKAPAKDKVVQEKSVQDDKLAGKARPAGMPKYVPPMRGAPVARVGGGTRGVGDSLPFVSVVTPEHTGYTSSPQPVLYWYLSEPMDTRFEFALINDNEIEPIIELTSDKEMQKGLNFLDLSEHGVSLKPGIIYQWSVALVGQPEKRSSDIVSSGTIELVELTGAQQEALGKVDDDASYRVFAGEGYWYDAFAGLSKQINANPGNTALVEQRTALLRQVGLDEVADSGK
jgi:hypothetical protein